MTRILLAVGMSFALVATALVATALANVPEPPGPPPRPPEPKPALVKTMPVKIERADVAKEGRGVSAKIAIPRKLLARLAVDTPAATEKQSSLPWWSTLVAGLAMSAGAVGLLIAARGNKAARVVAAGALLAATFAGGYAIAAKPAPEPAPKPAADPAVVVMEIVDDGDAVVITLPK